MVKVIQKEPADRGGHQIIPSGRPGLHQAFLKQGGLLMDIRKKDHLGKSTGLILNLPDSVQVFCTIPGSLRRSIHNSCR